MNTPKPLCADLLDRIENKHLNGYTSALAVSDLAHRLMAREAVDLWDWSMTGMTQRLKRHAAQVQQLGRYRQAIDEIAAIGIQGLGRSRDPGEHHRSSFRNNQSHR